MWRRAEESHVEEEKKSQEALFLCLEHVRNVNRQRPNLSSCRQTACKVSVDKSCHPLKGRGSSSLHARRRLRKLWTGGAAMFVYCHWMRTAAWGVWGGLETKV